MAEYASPYALLILRSRRRRRLEGCSPRCVGRTSSNEPMAWWTHGSRRAAVAALLTMRFDVGAFGEADDSCPVSAAQSGPRLLSALSCFSAGSE